jgi:tetratricopeptide (TPR) repeat protein
MILLTAILTACTWLAYASPYGAALPGLLPFLLLVAALPPLFTSLLGGSSSDARVRYAALAGAAWFALHPSHAVALAGTAHTPVLWVTAALALAMLPWEEFREWRSYGLCLAPLFATGLWKSEAILGLAPWRTDRSTEQWLAAAAAAGAALLAMRWRHARALSFGLGWFAAATLLLPGETALAFAGLALAVGWAAARAFTLMPAAEMQLVAAGFGALLLFHAVQISHHEVAAFASAPAAQREAQSPKQSTPQSPTQSPTADDLVNASRVLFDQGRYAESIRAAQGAVQIRPDFPEAYNNMGAAFAAMKKWDAAIAADLKALELRPDFQLARNNLVYARQQRSIGEK